MFSSCWYSIFLFFSFFVLFCSFIGFCSLMIIFFCNFFFFFKIFIYSLLGCDNNAGCLFTEVTCTQPTNLCKKTVRDPTYAGCCRTIDVSCSENTICETHTCNASTGLCDTTSLCVQDPNNLCKSFI